MITLINIPKRFCGETSSFAKDLSQECFSFLVPQVPWLNWSGENLPTALGACFADFEPFVDALVAHVVSKGHLSWSVCSGNCAVSIQADGAVLFVGFWAKALEVDLTKRFYKEKDCGAFSTS